MAAFNTLYPAGDVQNITATRDGHTVWMDIDQYNRWAPMQFFNHPVKLSRYDKVVMIADMTRPYIEAGVFAHMRNIDDVFITAAFGSAVQGATPGEVAASTFDTAAPNNDGTGGNLIAAGGTGMTSGKLKSAMGTLMTRNVGVDGMGRLNRGDNCIMMGGYQMKQLLDATEVTSWDFIGNLGPDNAPNVQGFVARYAGFDIFISNRLSLTSAVRRCVAWNKTAMGLAIWPGTEANRSGDDGGGGATTDSFYVTVDRLPDYNNATGSQVQAMFGSVRIIDKGVIGIDCTE
jgi:hypothetical protein